MTRSDASRLGLAWIVGGRVVGDQALVTGIANNRERFGCGDGLPEVIDRFLQRIGVAPLFLERAAARCARVRICHCDTPNT